MITKSNKDELYFYLELEKKYKRNQENKETKQKEQKLGSIYYSCTLNLKEERTKSTTTPANGVPIGAIRKSLFESQFMYSCRKESPW